MNSLRHWLHFGAAFLVVISVLMIAAAIHEWLEWRKDRRK